MAFAKVYSDPANIALRTAERRGAMQKLYPPVARTEPETEYGNSPGTGLAALEKLAIEFRRDHPFLTPEQSFAAVYTDPANSALAANERASAREKLYSPHVRIMA